MNKKRLTADFCVIGAGAGGLSFAAGAIQLGASVILIEKENMGGDCLNTGCIPSKSLIYTSKIAKTIIEDSKKIGWNFSKQELDFSLVKNHINNVIKKIEPNDSVERFEKLGVKVIKEEAIFLNNKTIATKTYEINAKRIIIATGSKPSIPKIEGIENIKYYTNENIFQIDELPKDLLVIGAGPIGVELAQAFKALGSNVTILDSKTILRNDDIDMVDIVKSAIINENINIEENVNIKSFKQNGVYVSVNYIKDNTEKAIEASHLLIATGREPNINNINLELAGIEFSKHGIKVDKKLKTTNPKVYAIGDCTGGYQFTHMAGYEAGIVVQNSIFKLGKKVNTKAIPWCTYTNPEIAHVGETEESIKNTKTKHKVLTLSFTHNDKAQTQLETNGKIKIIVGKKGKLLGATIVSKSAGELIFPWVMLMQNNLPISKIANTVAPYPTLNEINKRIAGMYYTPMLFNKYVRLVVKFLMWITK